MREVVARTEVGDADLVSRAILSVSPCRSGTTVLLRVFGAAGLAAHFQELKNVLRWRMQDRDASWALPQEPNQKIYLKETLGPYTEAEARFNPLDVLLRAGFPPKKLHVLILGRAPLSTWASWQHWWRDKTTVDKFIQAYVTTEQIRQQASQRRVPTTTLVYEALRDHEAEIVIEKLFTQLDVPFAPIAVGGWRRLPAFGAPGSNIVLPHEPPAFVVPRVHLVASEADALTYYSREKRLSGLRASDVDRIAQAGLPAIYGGWRSACQDALGLKITQDPDWASYARRNGR